MDEITHLRRLCVNDPLLATDAGGLWAAAVDDRTRALVTLGALVAVGASDPSVRAAVDDAITAGASTAQIVAVLDGLISVVGLPRVVAAAPMLAAALGHGEDITLDLPW